MDHRALLFVVAVSTLAGCRRSPSSSSGGEMDAAAAPVAHETAVDAGPVLVPREPTTVAERIAANEAYEKKHRAWVNETPAGFDWKNIAFAPYVSKRCGSGPAGYDPADDTCGFGLDVPTFLRKEEPQAEGGYRTFGGAGVEVFVSVHSYFEPIEKGWCNKARNVTVYKRYDTWCWQSGRDGDRIFWRKEKMGEDGNLYIVEIEYPAAHKKDMDGVVTRINATWHQPLTDADKSTPVDDYGGK
ncbi:hypothetical protein LVJ94_31895 [Pendulispora rubella]|uniref:Uncharacterized protein n=1 Tax=Pendulispora rubella TaxID=2741070 RepID=A0ABZ2KS77_9BACT